MAYIGDHGKDGVVLVKTILSMAGNLNLGTIAEGVETLEQLDTLKKYGCNLAQGFLFSPAVPPEAFEIILKKGRLVPDRDVNVFLDKKAVNIFKIK